MENKNTALRLVVKLSKINVCKERETTKKKGRAELKVSYQIVVNKRTYFSFKSCWG